jgi:hypothetical protein
MAAHWHRIAAFLVGCLILGSLFMIFVATQNFGTVDRVLAAPPKEAMPMLETLGAENSRLLLRYLAGEENRLFFTSWELAQIGLSTFATAILLLAIKDRLLTGLMGAVLIVALFQHFRVTPEMIALGRLVDFGQAGAAAYGQFWRLHGVYGVLEVAKLALLAIVAVGLLLRRRATAPEGLAVESTFANQA